MLGDTSETVERHYVPFVRELRETGQLILETAVGLEKPPQTAPEIPQNESKKPD